MQLLSTIDAVQLCYFQHTVDFCGCIACGFNLWN